MKVKHLLWSLLAITVMWSCGKDDDPAPPAAAPTIANFTPESGPVGTEITINGTNFSTTVASNTVKIGTATATVTAATATQLKATVPTGATTAKVTVTVGGNTATSTKDFTVTTTGGDDPTNEAPTAEEQSFEVAEDVAEGEVIGTVEANDGDGDELTFALVTDESELFQVAENGEISLAEGKNLDFETATEHILTLSVSDGTNEPVEFTVTVTVTNVIESLFEDPASFILKFDVTAGQDLTIGTNSNFEYDYTIDWGDGSEPENRTANTSPSHFYGSEGTYLVAIKGTFPALRMQSADYDSRNALVDVVQWGTQKWQSMRNTFYYCENLENFSATDQPDLSETTSMEQMFVGASNFNGNIGNWTTTNVTDMNFMFLEASSFNQDISSWNTSNVTNMSGMFADANAFNQPLVQTEDGWDTSKVTDMSFMFYNEGGTHTFNQDLSSWDTSNVTDMSYMFYNEGGTHAFDQSLGAWDISSVETMEGMLSNCGMSPENYAKTLIGWADDENGTQTIPESITLGAAGLDYCDNAGTAKVTLQSVLNGGYKWTITDGDAVDCPEFNNN
ncbi:MAG: BspA family leucine-rich repeat surface protein [Muricauda sp.]|nr:BspA family leucine-rich repeat surface protein [Allomuricauda sp.]MBO6533440.1 BspA family leucine-rich repeat surface protein [Allomuricauda sp.]MBO6588074.1 BspA family leucine-rich repeat surface protein [Allomuricauda sp.]MBO6617699.1 BspA family leucine-rich repeat surface protein [Allomuricauda sp.]MBO6643290.1 BspA family leucine-rich repeat surface protein [Allomuricauda sp.]MBO6746034.1 BspA family leucine-rich repeat surface protein [Allomuricauda sp.]